MGPHPAARSLSKQMRPGDAGAVSELCQRLISARLVHGALTQLPHQQTESAAVTTCPILRCAGQITEGRETSDVGARSWESSLVLKQQRAISMPFSPSERLPRWLSGKKKICLPIQDTEIGGVLPVVKPRQIALSPPHGACTPCPLHSGFPPAPSRPDPHRRPPTHSHTHSHALSLWPGGGGWVSP